MEEPSPAPRMRLLLISLGLVIAVFIAYWPVRGNGFIRIDDYDYVSRNTVVLKGLTWDGVQWAFGTIAVSNWHPVTWLSHMLDCDLFRIEGAAPGSDQWAGGHHLMSVGFHAVNAVLLFVLLVGMTGTFWRSALVAGLFALHPAHVESVAWVAERKDLLSTLFGLLAIMAYVRWTRWRGRWTYAAIMVLFSLSLMSKPMLVTLPFVLLLLDYWPLRRSDVSHDRGEGTGRIWMSLVLEKLPLFALAAASGIITVIGQSQGGAMMQESQLGIGSRLATAAVAYAQYVRLMVWPTDLAVLYPHPFSWPVFTVIVSAVLLAAITFVVVATRRSGRHNVVGWCWFLGTLVPVIGLVQVGGQFMADRYSYVPSIGLSIMISWTAGMLARGAAGRRIMTAVAVMVLALLAAMTHARTQDWRDTITLFQDALNKTEGNVYLAFLLGLELQEQGRLAEAIPHLEGFFDRAPQDAALLVRYAEAMGAVGRFRKAYALYERAYALDASQFPAQSLNNYACILSTSPDASMRNGRLALQLAKQAAEMSPTPEPRSLFILAVAHAEVGDFMRAIDAAQRAEALATAMGDAALAKAIGGSIAVFESGQPLRDLPVEPQ